MLAYLGIFSGLICLVSLIVWICMAVVKNKRLSRIWKRICFIFFFIFLVCGIVSAVTSKSSSASSKNTSSTYKGLRVYPVKVSKVSVNEDGDLVVKGTSKAPNGAKVLAQSLVADSTDENEASPTDLDNYGYAKIKNGKFNITLDTINLYEDTNLKIGQKVKAKIFAVVGYKVKYDDYKISTNLNKAIKKTEIPVFSYSATKKMCQALNDGSEDDSSSDADNTSETNESSESSHKKKNAPNSSKSEKISMALAILKENYKGKAEVKYNSSDDMFTILPTMDGYIDIIHEAEDGDTDNWDTVTDSIDKVSKALYEDVKLKMPVSLVNPANEEKVLYTSIDGLSAYDFTDD